jgi:hypothetical protein
MTYSRILSLLCTGHTQKNGAVSKVNKKCMSHLTWAQHTPSAAATVQVSHALPAVRFSCLLRDRITHALQAITADMLHRVWDEFHYRVDVCRVTHMRNLDSCRRWRCMLCPCKVRNTFFIHFWYAPFFCVCPVYIHSVVKLKKKLYRILIDVYDKLYGVS